MTTPTRLRVLHVTGAYAPEFSAGGLQAQAVSKILAPRIDAMVLTTSTNRALPAYDKVDDVPVSRIHVDLKRGSFSAVTALRMLRELIRLVPRVDAVHIQGYSTKNILVSAVAGLWRRPVVLHLQTAKHDEPPAVAAQGRLAWWAFSSATRYIGVSRSLVAAARSGGIAASRIEQIPNGVDIMRFTPAAAAERPRLRERLGLPTDRPMVLFVGVLMPDKQPQVLLEAWSLLQAQPATQSSLVFVGASNPQLFELQDRLAETLRAEVARRGLTDRVWFVEPTNSIHNYYAAADLVVMPSLREGLPNVLLEAMSCALPVVASRLPGATDILIEDRVNGRLVDPGDVAGFAGAIGDLLRDRAAAADIGARARATVEARFQIRQVAEQWLSVYERIGRDRQPA